MITFNCPICNYKHDNQGDRYGCPNCEGESMLSEKADGKTAKACELTPAKVCKSYGTTLQRVSEVSEVNRDTLRNWCYNKPKLFHVVIEGVLARDI